MSEIKNGRLGHYGTKHSKCNPMMTPGFKGLNWVNVVATGSRSDCIVCVYV